jgi:thioredoxin reductase
MVIDCAILGGDPAGLSAALVLGRAKRTVVVFDDVVCRNSRLIHNFGDRLINNGQAAVFLSVRKKQSSSHKLILHQSCV